MPQKRWRGGSMRQASAMTTALSPDRTILMPMILAAPTQNETVRKSAMYPSTARPSGCVRFPAAARSGAAGFGLKSRWHRSYTSVTLQAKSGWGNQQRAQPTASAASLQPTISLPEKNCAISLAAVSAASEPCTEFSPIERACTLRMVPGAALPGSVAPITSR